MSSSTSAIQSIILLYSLLNLQEDSCSYSTQCGVIAYFCSAVQILENIASLFLYSAHLHQEFQLLPSQFRNRPLPDKCRIHSEADREPPASQKIQILAENE